MHYTLLYIVTESLLLTVESFLIFMIFSYQDCVKYRSACVLKLYYLCKVGLYKILILCDFHKIKIVVKGAVKFDRKNIVSFNIFL